MEEGGVGCQKELCSPQSYVVRPFPLISTSHGSGQCWFCLPKPKTYSPEVLGPTLRSWGSIEPYSSHAPLFLSFTIHRQTNGTVVRLSCHGPMPGGN